MSIFRKPSPAEEGSNNSNSNSNSNNNTYKSYSKSTIQWNEDVEILEEDEDQDDVDFEHDGEDEPRKSRRSRMRQVKLKQAWAEDEMATEEALMRRAFHLPINTTPMQDWRQYLANNHPVFGICCSHPLSPINWSQRIMALGASVCLGYSITGLSFYWALLKNEDAEPFFSLPFANNHMGNEETNSWEVTIEVVFLFTWMACAHSLVDLLILYCLHHSTWAYLLWMMTMAGGSVVVTGLIVSRDPTEDEYDPITAVIYASFELALVWTVYYFLVASFLFSGILGCFRLPILGGRPREMQLEAARKKEAAKGKKVSTIDSLADWSEYQ